MRPGANPQSIAIRKDVKLEYTNLEDAIDELKSDLNWVTLRTKGFFNGDKVVLMVGLRPMTEEEENDLRD